MPFATTRVIPLGWSAHHQAAVEGSFNANVIIVDPSRTTPGVFDPETGTTGPSSAHVVAGGPDDTNPDWQSGVPCRIQRLKDDRAVEHAEQQVTVRLYLIQLPADVPDIEVGYRATVTAAHNDPHLVGQALAASDVMHGSELFNRDVVWIHNQQPPQEA